MHEIKNTQILAKVWARDTSTHNEVYSNRRVVEGPRTLRLDYDIRNEHLVAVIRHLMLETFLLVDHEPDPERLLSQ